MRETDAHFESWLGQKIQARKAERAQAVSYTIPIIFHIISKGEAVGTSPNVSAQSITEQLLQLNKDYANQSNSPYAVAANTGIQFVLAKTNTSGATLAEPGIDRINSTVQGWTDYSVAGWTSTYMDQTVKPASIWNPDNYYNVWIVPSITSGAATLLGYSTFPTSSTLAGLSAGETATTAGVVVQTGTIGSAFAPFNCGASYGLGKTLSHETGHFFGLRHIWGDTDCGTDYCDDTPVHFTSNSGVPSHPKPNSCGTPDEMFENYMDYTDDILLNTFTNDQVSRMQTVMLNSPRRVTLATSSVGGVTVAASNKVSFENCTGVLSVSETGTTGTYPRYRDINLTLNVEDKATGPATVTVTATGTAVNNFHYQLLTPTLNFAAGDNYKDVKVRVFDNAEVDGNRTVILNYTISGTGVTAGSTAQTLTLTIRDNDNVKIGNNPVALINENFGTSGNTAASWQSGSFISPIGPNKWTLGSNGGAGITGQALYITNNVTTRPLAYSADTASDAILVSPKVNTDGYASTTLSFNYKCNGEADAQGIYDYGRLMYSYDISSFAPLTDSSGNQNQYQGVTAVTNTGNIILPAFLHDTAFYIGFRWTNDNNTGTNPPFLIDDVMLNATPYPIATGAGTSYGFDVRSNTVNNFTGTTSNSIIATISNAGSGLSGIAAQISQAGTGITGITTTGGSFTRTQKVFQISPATADATTTYQATLYFTEAELAAWGANKLNLQILKVTDGVDLNSILNSSDAQLITPVVAEHASDGYIAYTGSFTGFSQFMLVSPATVLPVTLIDFTLQANQKNIVLFWSTALEINNKGFAIERSINGTAFTQIGFINGKGNSSSRTSYTFTDNFVQPGVLYYYRLRQINTDNREAFSPIRNTRINASAGVEVTVSPNPASDHINIFISGTSSKATIELISAGGQKIKQVNNINAYDGIYNLSIPTLAKGVYSIRVILPEGTYTKEVMIE